MFTYFFLFSLTLRFLHYSAYLLIYFFFIIFFFLKPVTKYMTLSLSLFSARLVYCVFFKLFIAFLALSSPATFPLYLPLSLEFTSFLSLSPIPDPSFARFRLECRVYSSFVFLLILLHSQLHSIPPIRLLNATEFFLITHIVLYVCARARVCREVSSIEHTRDPTVPRGPFWLFASFQSWKRVSHPFFFLIIFTSIISPELSNK